MPLAKEEEEHNKIQTTLNHYDDAQFPKFLLLPMLPMLPTTHGLLKIDVLIHGFRCLLLCGSFYADNSYFMCVI